MEPPAELKGEPPKYSCVLGFDLKRMHLDAHIRVGIIMPNQLMPPFYDAPASCTKSTFMISVYLHAQLVRGWGPGLTRLRVNIFMHLCIWCEK